MGTDSRRRDMVPFDDGKAQAKRNTVEQQSGGDMDERLPFFFLSGRKASEALNATLARAPSSTWACTATKVPLFSVPCNGRFTWFTQPIPSRKERETRTACPLREDHTRNRGMDSTAHRISSKSIRTREAHHDETNRVQCNTIERRSVHKERTEFPI